MNSWQTLVVAIVSLVLGGGGSAAIVTALAKRRVTRVEAADRLSDSALDVADKLSNYATNAMRDADLARQETVKLRNEMASVRREAQALAWELHRLRMAIMDPYVTLERLRAMVDTAGPGSTLSTPQ